MCCVSESRCWQWGLQGCLLQEQAGSAPWWTQPALASSNRPTPQGTAEALSHGFKKGKNASWTEEKEWQEKEGEREKQPKKHQGECSLWRDDVGGDSLPGAMTCALVKGPFLPEGLQPVGKPTPKQRKKCEKEGTA